MISLSLIRHGESQLDNLTINGREQVRLAAERWRKLWDGATTCILAAPAKRTVDSAVVFASHMKLPILCEPLLAIKNYHTPQVHLDFAQIAVETLHHHIVIVGHDETRKWCEAIVWRKFRRQDVAPYVPLGGILRFTEKDGFVIH